MNINIEHLLSQFSKKHILVVGDIMLDEWFNGKNSVTSAEAPINVFNTKIPVRDRYQPPALV